MATERLLQLRRLAELKGVKPDVPDAAIEPERDLAAQSRMIPRQTDPASMPEFNARDFPEQLGGDVTDVAAKVPGLRKIAPELGYGANVAAQYFSGGPLSKAPSAIAKAAPAAKDMGAAASKAIGSMAPKIAPEVSELAQKAHAMGIKIPLDALSDNRILKVIGQAFREVPLSGDMTGANREAFNGAIIKLIGGDEKATKISPQVYDAAMSKSGKTIGDISAKNPIPFDAALAGKLDEHSAHVMGFEPDEGIQRVVNNYIKEIRDAGAAKGQIDGEVMRKIRTQLTSQMRTTSNGDLKHALSELDETLLDSVHAQLTPAERETFDAARTQYAIGKTIEPLIAKAAVKGSGDMSPAAFANQLIATKSGKSMIARGRGGKAGDIAAVGSKFLTEPGSSNTAERGLAYTALGGGGLAGGVPAAAGIWGGANLYNRVGPKVARKLTQSTADKAIGTKP